MDIVCGSSHQFASADAAPRRRKQLGQHSAVAEAVGGRKREAEVLNLRTRTPSRPPPLFQNTLSSNHSKTYFTMRK